MSLSNLSRKALGGVLLFAIIPSLHGTIFIIGDNDIPGLTDAINMANGNNQDDTIVLASGGHYAVTSAALTAFPVITSDNGHALTINGQGATLTDSNFQLNTRFFDIAGNNVTVTNLTMDKGNTASDGGAIRNGGGTLTVTNCSFTFCAANNNSSSGGAVASAGTLFVQGCTFSHDEAVFGGALYNTGSMTVTNCVFSANEAIPVGGAIANAGNATVTGCTFTQNFATFTNGYALGGAIYNTGTFGIYSSTFDSNYAMTNDTRSYGGAIVNHDGSLTLTNCTLFNNNAYQGGVESESMTGSASLSIVSCTFLRNSSGQIYLLGVAGHPSTLAIANTILGEDGNYGTLPDVVVSGPVTVTSQGFNLCHDTGGGYFTAPGDQVNTDAKLDPSGLQNNDGSTRTIALAATSPAIDKGKSFTLTDDQAGQSRPFDLPGYPSAIGGDGSDIGALEMRDPIQAGMALVVNSLADHDDHACGTDDCTLREAINHANADLNFQYYSIAFAPGVSGTITLASELWLNRNITITGPGARNLAVSGNSAHRVFTIGGNGGSITGLTIRDGNVVAAAGAAGQGGGVYCGAQFTFTDCMFTSNHVVGGNGSGGQGSPGANGQGGAIYLGSNAISLTLTGCTFASGNTATGGNGITSGGGVGGAGGLGQGGDIFNAGSGLAMTNCTVAGGTATGGNGGSGTSFGGAGGAAIGGGVSNAGSLTMTNCTVSGNAGTGGTGGTGNFNGVAGVGSGGIANLAGGSATITNTLVANNNRTNNGGADVDGSFTSGGYNLIATTDHSTGFTSTGDMTGTDASPVNPGLIGPPGNTGGPTDTFNLFFTSRAIDAGNDSSAPHRDQRGYLRTGHPDIGSFEYNGSLVRLVNVSRRGLNLVIQAEVVKGKIYSLERKANITDSQWQSIPGIPDKTATGNDIETFTDFTVFSLTRAFEDVRFVP
ncbi:MAG: choice-of-anchor Q domain-containing protein [Chthoniobacterales bacterium]